MSLVGVVQRAGQTSTDLRSTFGSGGHTSQSQYSCWLACDAEESLAVTGSYLLPILLCASQWQELRPSVVFSPDWHRVDRQKMSCRRSFLGRASSFDPVQGREGAVEQLLSSPGSIDFEET